MRKIAIFIALVLLLALCATPAHAVPALPHAFYGSVTVNGAAASDGTEVSATVAGGSVITNTQNPTTTSGGSYGVNSPHLLVQGYDIPDGATITFHVTNEDGTATGGTATFEAGGGPTEKDLSVTITKPSLPPSEPAMGPGGGAPPQPPVETDLFGIEEEFKIGSDGKIEDRIEATSADGMLTLTIKAGTIALDEDGEPLESLESAVDESPPDPPEGAHVIGAFDFGPDGATFDPPITITWNYDPEDLPENMDLVIAYYDEDDGEWVYLPVERINNTLTASVSHFTSFALIAVPKPAAFTLSSLAVSPTEVAPGEKVNISVSVANTGGTEGSYKVVLEINGVKEAEKSVTVAAGSIQAISFSVAKEKAGSYNVVVDGLSSSFTVVVPPVPPKPPPVPKPPAPTPAPPKPPPPTPPAPEVTAPVVPPPPEGINWPMVGGIIAAAIVVGLIIFFLVRRRA
jgi:hypothetical protein